MKMLFVCLSMIIGFQASAMSIVAQDPMLLQELYKKAGTMYATDMDGEKYLLAEVLGEAMGYPFKDVSIEVTHDCDFNASPVECTLIITSTDKVEPSTESATIIRYKVKYEDFNENVEVLSATVDFAG